MGFQAATLAHWQQVGLGDDVLGEDELPRSDDEIGMMIFIIGDDSWGARNMEEGLRCDLTGGKIMTQGLLPLSFSLSQLISTYLESSQLAWTTVKNMNGSIVNVPKMMIKENQVLMAFSPPTPFPPSLPNLYQPTLTHLRCLGQLCRDSNGIKSVQTRITNQPNLPLIRSGNWTFHGIVIYVIVMVI